MEITIRPLSPALLDDFLSFFDNMTFPDHPDWSVVCFLIDSAHRRKGVAARLLERVCLDYGDLGYDCLEAYPQNNPDAEYCQGPPALYLHAGFKVVREFEGFCLAGRKIRPVRGAF